MKGKDLQRATEVFKEVQELKTQIKTLNTRAKSLLEKDQKVDLELIFEPKEVKKVVHDEQSDMPQMPKSLMDFLGGGKGGSMIFGMPQGGGGAFGSFDTGSSPEDLFSVKLDEVEALVVIQSLISIKTARLDRLKLELETLGVKQ